MVGNPARERQPIPMRVPDAAAPALGYHPFPRPFPGGAVPQSIVQVDAFADRPFRGNPAAVCILEAPRAEEWMQAVAAEMNLSETAFLEERPGGFDLRWFTPVAEVDLCGHATLASAHVLWEEKRLAPTQPAVFHTRSGRLMARRAVDRIEMDLPADPPAEAQAPPALHEALRSDFRHVGVGRFDFLVELESEAEVRALRPDLGLLASLTSRGVIVTAAATGKEFDFVSRFFAPRFGIDEDPVTGSAHCCLGPYWGSRLGKEALVGYQASSRGGVVHVRLAGARVILGGQAVTVLRGTLTA
jgi:PhzF family phenazine biosynthesis protein